MYPVNDSAERGLVFSKYRVFLFVCLFVCLFLFLICFVLFLFLFLFVLVIPNKFGP